jgi:hypothetical protein
MRALVLSLVVSVSPVAMTVCQLTCAMPAAVDVPAAACHESSQPSDGPALKARGECRHSEGDLLLAKATSAFQLSVAPAQASTPLVVIDRPIGSFDATAIPAISPPLRLLPLRI